MGLIFNTSLAHQSIAAVTENVKDAFDIGIIWVNLSITLAPLVYIPMSFLATYMFNNYRRDNVLKFAAALQILGALCRMGSALYQSFWPIFIGSLILASSAPFGFNSISIISNVWFGD
jgi:predicted MFS family arabinose efflux permease